jgi:hypothetical protein
MTLDLRDLGLVASGKVGTDWVYQKNGRRRAYVVPTNPQTAAQTEWREKWRDVQLELVLCSDEIKSALYDLLGYRWHAILLGMMCKDDAAALQPYFDDYDLFSVANKIEWSKWDDVGLSYYNEGSLFYAVAAFTYQQFINRGAEAPYTLPTETNSETLGEEWERDMSYYEDVYPTWENYILSDLDTWEDIGIKATVPADGNYKLHGVFFGLLMQTLDRYTSLIVMVKNFTQSTVLTDSELNICYILQGGLYMGRSASGVWTVSASAGDQIGIIAQITSSGTWANLIYKRLRNYERGKTHVIFEKI